MELSISSALSFDGEGTPSNSRTSTLTRGMSLMGDRELELLCMQEFGKCDADGDGIITQVELQEQCGDDPELAKMLMEAMDSDNDGQISFEDFRSSMLKVKTQLLATPAAQSTDADTSTPAKNGTKHGMSNFLTEESIFESDPSTNECEEEWFKAMERIDPTGLVSSNTELKAVWVELMMRDPALLDQFESFLTEIINTLEQKQENCIQVEQHIRRVLSNHSKQVLEMDDVLQDRLREASYQQQVEIEERHRRLSSQYQGLIQDKDEAILQLAKSEEALRRELNDHSQSEQELRREKEMLLKLNKYLKDQLRASHKKLSLSQGLVHRLRHVPNGDASGIHNGSLDLDEEPLPSANGSLTFADLPLSPTSSSFNMSYPQSSVLVVENVLPLDQEVRRALLSEEEESLLPHTPTQEQPEGRAGLPTLCTPQRLTESIEESVIHSVPVQNLPGYSHSSKQLSLVLAQPQGSHDIPHSPEPARIPHSPEPARPRPTYLYKTLPTEGLPSQSELERQLQADLVKYAQKQAHAESSERRRENVHLKSPQGAIQCVQEDAGLSSQGGRVPPDVMVNGSSRRSSLSSVSNDESDQSCLSWSFVRETNSSSERVLEDFVLVQQNSDLQHGCPENTNPSNHQGPSGVAIHVATCTKETQSKVAEDRTSSSSPKVESVASSLDSSLASKPASSPSTVSHLKPPTNQTHSPTSWAGQRTIGINMGTPSVSLSTFITHRDDLPSPSTVTPNRIFKVMFLGDSGVGKTSIIRRLSQGVFTANVRSTIGLDFAVAVIQVGEEPVAFQLWDTAGQERFQATTGVYLRRADAFVIVYDVTNKTTFQSVRRWMTLVKAVLRNDLPAVMIMGNKSDCSLGRMVTQEEGHKLALELSTLFSETSALSGDNVLQSQTTLASLLLERQNNEIDKIRTSMFQLDKTGEKKRCGC